MSLTDLQDAPKVTPQKRTSQIRRFAWKPAAGLDTWNPVVKPEVIQRLEVEEKPIEVRVRTRGIYPYVKRIIDITGALGLLILLSPQSNCIQIQ